MVLRAGVLRSQVEQTLRDMNSLTKPVLVNTFKYFIDSGLDCKWEKIVKEGGFFA